MYAKLCLDRQNRIIRPEQDSISYILVSCLWSSSPFKILTKKIFSSWSGLVFNRLKWHFFVIFKVWNDVVLHYFTSMGIEPVLDSHYNILFTFLFYMCVCVCWFWFPPDRLMTVWWSWILKGMLVGLDLRSVAMSKLMIFWKIRVWS